MGPITRPKNCTPTGTLRRLPVAKVRSPPRMPWSAPKRMTSTCLRSRFRTMPCTPLGNVTSSSNWTDGSPESVATPLPICCTVPTFLKLTWGFTSWLTLDNFRTRAEILKPRSLTCFLVFISWRISATKAFLGRLSRFFSRKLVRSDSRICSCAWSKSIILFQVDVFK